MLHIDCAFTNQPHVFLICKSDSTTFREKCKYHVIYLQIFTRCIESCRPIHTPRLMMNTGNMASVSCFLLHERHAKILHGENTMFCYRQLKITCWFLIKFLFLGLNFAKVATFRSFSFSLTF